MTLRPACIAVTLACLLFPFIASAQEPATSPTPDEKAEQALEKKVFDLVESIAARAVTLHSLANRVRIESTLVDL